jgi:putative ABC transport system permease protein
MAVERAGLNILEEPGRSAMIILSVGTGVALAISIIAASNGVQEEVNILLNAQQLPPEISVTSIQQTLIESRSLLTKLAFDFTAALVGLVTWVSMGQRRRQIGLARQHGLYIREILIELLSEAAVLCLVGGIVGVIAGNLLCAVIQHSIPNLPMHPRPEDVVLVFPVVTLLSFVATAAVAAYFAIRTEVQPKI